MPETVIRLEGVGRTRDGGLVADRALALIRKAIAEGEIGPGGRINEVEIAQRLGSSRGPVREAIRRLCASGLVVYEPNIGGRVVSPDVDAVGQIYAVREALEALAAKLAAQQMSDAERRLLAQTLDRHEAQMTEANSNAYPRGSADWDFHHLVLKGARNEVVWRICGEEMHDIFSLLRGQHGSSAGRGRRALQEHRWVADAIIAGHADLASTLMAQHIRASRDNLLAAMRVRAARTG